MKKKLISIITPTYNEVDNVDELVLRINSSMKDLLGKYDYEHIFIDNNSTDGTIDVIKKLCKKNKRIKLIVNTRNFGHVRSPFYGLLQGTGSANILISSDLQDPPELIPQMIQKWESGSLNVLIVKPTSNENKLLFNIRKIFYKFIRLISEVRLIENATGAGLFDKKIITHLKKIEDPYPYFRGLICDLGFPLTTIEFNQPARKNGVTKNNFFTLYDMAFLGITSFSKLPLRLITIFGFLFSIFSLILAVIFFVIKLIFWDSFVQGYAPILITIFVLFSILMFFIGILGEYILSIHTQVKKRPLVYELERINFDK